MDLKENTGVERIAVGNLHGFTGGLHAAFLHDSLAGRVSGKESGTDAGISHPEQFMDGCLQGFCSISLVLEGRVDDVADFDDRKGILGFIDPPDQML